MHVREGRATPSLGRILGYTFRLGALWCDAPAQMRLKRQWNCGLLKTSNIDSTAYREAMSRFAGAVNVVTTDGKAGRRGVTVSAACSVSDNPATLLVCLNRANPFNKMFEENGVFVLNTLASAQQSLAVAFSGKDHLTQDERFALAEWETLESGGPVLVNALASFDCRLIDAKDVATHRVLFGEVTAIRTAANLTPLVYHNRGYHTF
jgi:cob(II)yrinic acid a,c-diamide reductase